MCSIFQHFYDKTTKEKISIRLNILFLAESYYDTCNLYKKYLYIIHHMLLDKADRQISKAG